MATFTIQSKTLLASVDRAADLLLIADQSASYGLKNTTVNNLLNVTSQPVGISDSQTLTNKVMDNTNTITLKDTLFTLQDDADTTKQARFQLSGITTATTRTYTLPNGNVSLVGDTSTQTLTNKTLTSPTINTPTITNPTITVDTISEFTAANGVTIDGVKLKDGALATNNSVVTANITDGAVTPAKLTSGTGSSWSWQTWAPTLTNLSGGTLNYAKYIQDGKTVFFRFKYTLAGAGVAGAVTITLPVTAAYGTNDFERINGIASLCDTGTAIYTGVMVHNNSTPTTKMDIRVLNASGTYLGETALSSTVPHTWATTDVLFCIGSYEAA